MENFFKVAIWILLSHDLSPTAFVFVILLSVTKIQMTIISASISLRPRVFQPLEMTDLSINILLTNTYHLFATFSKQILWVLIVLAKIY